MKRTFKIFTLLIALVVLFTMTSCSGKDEGYQTIDLTNSENITLTNVIVNMENKTVKNPKGNDSDANLFIGYIDTKTNTYYFENAKLYTTNKNDEEVLIDGTFKAVFVNKDKIEENYEFVGFLEKGETIKLYSDGSSSTIENKEAIFVKRNNDQTVSLPNVSADNKIFSGWYKDADYTFGNKVTLTNQASNVLYARFINFAEGAVVTVICILIVFLMLALLFGVTSLIKYVNKKKAENVEEQKPIVQEQPKKSFTMDDIKDDDMMAAALVATIEYHNETKKDVRVVSIKEIK